MKALGNILKWASWVVLVASVICGIVFAQNAEDDALLVFLYWAIGGGLFFMFSMAQSYVLSVAICVKEKIDKDELERVKQSEKQMPSKKTYADTSPVRPITHDGDSHITCPICGCTQISDMFCLECGIEFVRTNK